VRPIVGGRLAGVFVLLLAAACGGERRAESAAVDSAVGTGPVTPPDSVTAILPDTGTQPPATKDSSADVSVPGSAVARRSIDTAPDSAERAPAPAPKPAAQRRDTQPAQSRPTAPAQQQVRPAQDTATSQAAAADTAPAAETAPAAPQQQAAQPAQPAQEAPLRDEYHQAPRDTVNQTVYDGWKQYNLNCARCHGEDVLGTTIAPHLVTSLKPDGPINTKEAFMQVVCAGRPEKGMPAWCPLGLGMDKIDQIYNYVKGRSAGEIGPGRPAVRQEG
jgi:hypothetical protein